MLICQVCEYEAVSYDREKGIIGDTFTYISWELVDKGEYAARLKDGRTSQIEVCPDCFGRFTGSELKSIGDQLHVLNQARKQEGIL